MCLKCNCEGSAAEPQPAGLFCFLVAGADSGAQRPSRFWLGSLLSARRLQPDVSGVLPTALYVRKARVEVASGEEPAYKEGWQGENTLLDLNVVGYGEPPDRMRVVGFASVPLQML